MRINNSKQVIGLALKAALLSVTIVFAACSGDEESPQAWNESPVTFSAKSDKINTRATITTGLRKIGVFGYSHTGDFDSDPASRTPDFFLNQAVIDLPGNGTWTYNGVRKYWPQDGSKVSFFAYAPYIDVEETFTLYPLTTAGTGAPKITYTVPAGIYDQIDLIYGNRANMTYATSNGGQVDFTMKHALTRVDFVVKLDAAEKNRPFVVEFKELTVRNVAGGGTLDLSKSVDAWTAPRPVSDEGWASYTMTPDGLGGLVNLVFDARVITPDTGAGQTDAWDWNNLFRPGQYLMLIPQDLEGKPDGLTPAEISLKYTFTNVYTGEVANIEEIIPLARAIPVWEPGVGITYQLTISLMEGTAVEFDIKATPWDDQNSDKPITGSVG